MDLIVFSEVPLAGWSSIVIPYFGILEHNYPGQISLTSNKYLPRGGHSFDMPLNTSMDTHNYCTNTQTITYLTHTSHTSHTLHKHSLKQPTLQSAHCYLKSTQGRHLCESWVLSLSYWHIRYVELVQWVASLIMLTQSSGVLSSPSPPPTPPTPWHR